MINDMLEPGGYGFLRLCQIGIFIDHKYQALFSCYGRDPIQRIPIAVVDRCTGSFLPIAQVMGIVLLIPVKGACFLAL